MVLYFNLYYEYMLYKLAPRRYVSGQLTTDLQPVLQQLYDADEERRLAKGFQSRSRQLGFEYFVETVFKYYLTEAEHIDLKPILDSSNTNDWKLYRETVKAWAMTPLKFFIKKNYNSEAAEEKDPKRGFVLLSVADTKEFGVPEWDKSCIEHIDSFFSESVPSQTNDADDNGIVPLKKIRIKTSQNLTNSQKRKRLRMLRETGITETELLVAQNMAVTQDELINLAETMIGTFFQTPKSLDILKLLDHLDEWPPKGKAKDDVFDSARFDNMSANQIDSLADKLSNVIAQQMEKLDDASVQNFYVNLPKYYGWMNQIINSAEFKSSLSKHGTTIDAPKDQDSDNSGQDEKATAGEKAEIIRTLIGEDQDGNSIHPSHAKPSSENGSEDGSGKPRAAMLPGSKNRMKNRNLNGLLANSKFTISQYQKSKNGQKSATQTATTAQQANSKQAVRLGKNQNVGFRGSFENPTASDSANTFSPSIFLAFLTGVNNYNEILPG